jgi:hypothetical protein
MNKSFLDYEGLTDYDRRIKGIIEAKHANDATVPDVEALEVPEESDIDTLATDIANKVAVAFMSATEENVTVVITT